MSAILVKPMPFTLLGSTQQDTGYNASNLNLDIPLLVWRYTNTLANLYIDMGAGVTAYDTLSLVGSNLISTDTIRIIVSDNSDMSSPTTTQNYTAAFTGTKPDGLKTVSIIRFAATTKRYIRITIDKTANPSAFVQAQRLVIGKAVETSGIDVNAEQSFEDQSIFFDGAGYASVDEYEVLPTWKATLSWISDEQWRTSIFPLLLSVGRKKAILFVPKMEFPDRWQTEAMFGRITSVAKGQHNSSDNWIVEFVMRALAA